MAIRKKLIEVKALLIPVTPAFFLFLTTIDIEITREIISITDNRIGISLIASFIYSVYHLASIRMTFLWSSVVSSHHQQLKLIVTNRVVQLLAIFVLPSFRVLH